MYQLTIRMNHFGDLLITCITSEVQRVASDKARMIGVERGHQDIIVRPACPRKACIRRTHRDFG